MCCMENPGVPKLCQVVLDSTNPRLSAEFWRQLLGLTYREGHEPPSAGAEDIVGQDWLNLYTPGGEPCLAFQKVPRRGTLSRVPKGRRVAAFNVAGHGSASTVTPGSDRAKRRGVERSAFKDCFAWRKLAVRSLGLD